MVYLVAWYNQEGNHLGSVKVDSDSEDDLPRLVVNNVLRYDRYNHFTYTTVSESDPVNFNQEWSMWESIKPTLPVEYVNRKGIAKEIRDNLKAVFGKGFKFSVTTDINSIKVKLMSAPYEICMDEEYHYIQTNHYYPENEYRLTKRGRELMKLVYEIALYRHWDKSDPMTDYFNTNYYLSTGVGDWNRPFEIQK